MNDYPRVLLECKSVLDECLSEQLECKSEPDDYPRVLLENKNELKIKKQKPLKLHSVYFCHN